MDVKLREEINRLIEIGSGKKIIRTSTVVRLLNDLNSNTQDEYEGAIDYLESRGIGLEVDDSERKPFLDSSKISITPRTLSVEAIVKKIKYGEINLDTEFQRKRSLWKDDVKSQLIESFMVQLPIPPMYFDGKREDSWLVIDGLQRLCTLKEFILDKKLVLSELEYLSDYNGCKFDDLPRIYQRRVEEAQIAFYLILPGTPSDVKYSLFKRINTPGLRLEPQEIRHALYQGRATKFLQELSENKMFGIVTDGDVPSERMQDREMILRYFAVRYLGEDKYKDQTLDGYLCEAMEFLNQQKDNFFEENRALFLNTLECCHKIFGKQAFRRISQSKPFDKKPINSALFEAWMNGVSKLTDCQRQSLTDRKDKLRERYIEELDKRSTFNADISSGKYRSFVRRNRTIEEMIEEILKDDKKD